MLLDYYRRRLRALIRDAREDHVELRLPITVDGGADVAQLAGPPGNWDGRRQELETILQRTAGELAAHMGTHTFRIPVPHAGLVICVESPNRPDAGNSTKKEQ